ncbi:MAG: GNAT family N-acetyltransferase [Acidobacteriota bacterium]|jgi:RimJ/RimL family protein N-acetyltransferase
MTQIGMVRLISQDAAMRAALEHPKDFREGYDADPAGQEEWIRTVVDQTLELQSRNGAVPPWTGYLAVCSRTGRVIGCGGFKGNPTPAGDVEIAYFTFPDHERQGFGAAIAAELFRIAASRPGPRRVLAHTLPQPNASTRILERLGFSRLGEVEDPEDGTVWRWRRDLSRDDAG